MNTFLVKTSGLPFDESGSTQTLMFIHGWGMNSQVWSGIKSSLEDKFHLIWVDLPGHGFNRECEANNLDDIIHLVSEHTPKKCNIVAWSLGGIVAQALANRFPQRIQRMMLVTSTPRFSQIISGDITPWLHAISEATLLRFAKNLKQDTLKTLKGFIALQFIGIENAKSEADALIKKILEADEPMPLEKGKKGGGAKKTSEGVIKLPNEHALDVGLAILMHCDLRKVEPTWSEHWVFGEYDKLIPKEVINDLKSVRPNAQITLLKKAGHAPFMTHPYAFIKCLTTFISS